MLSHILSLPPHTIYASGNAQRRADSSGLAAVAALAA